MVQVREIHVTYKNVVTLEEKINKFLSGLRNEEFVGISFADSDTAYVAYRTDKAVHYKEDDD
jgi:hypothetical protein